MREINIIPMAGEGIRFKKFTNIPKPMIKIDNDEMILHATKSLSKADLWIFICQKNHSIKYKLKELLNTKFKKKYILIELNKLSQGQASTCYEASKYLNPDDKINIGSCDSTIFYNQIEAKKILTKSDILIYTFKNQKFSNNNPYAYGWVKPLNKYLVNKISCKFPISNNPKQDMGIVGNFSFSKASIFINAYKRLKRNNTKVNNEFYLDVLVNDCLKNNIKTSYLEVKDYYSWGTPEEMLFYKKNYSKKNARNYCS